MSEACHICEKPVSRLETPFLHMIRHIQQGEAIGRFDGRGHWWFAKPALSQAEGVEMVTAD